MSFCYPSSPRKLAMTVACFASGAALFAIGIHFSYLNVAPQQARTKARNDFVKERLRQKQGKFMWTPHPRKVIENHSLAGRGISLDIHPDDPPATHKPHSPALTNCVTRLTALFDARYGWSFRMDLTDKVHMNPLFDFMKRENESFTLYKRFVKLYKRVIVPCTDSSFTASALSAFLDLVQFDKPDEELETDLLAFLSGVDIFATNDHYDLCSPIIMYFHPRRVSQFTEHGARNQCGAQDFQPDASATHETNLGPPPIRITLKELCIIKLTAMFDVRYGNNFRRALMMRVLTNPLFEFLFFRRVSLSPQLESMDPTEIRFNIFYVLVKAYERVLLPSKELRKRDDARMGAVLDVFFNILQLKKKLDGEVEAAMINLHAFVFGVDCFSHIGVAAFSAIMPPPERFSVMMKPDMLVQLPLGFQRFSDQYQCLGDYLSLPPPIHQPGSPYHLESLQRRVMMNPWFNFSLHYDSRYTFYEALRAAYSSVLNHSKKLKKSDACRKTVLEDFFNLVQLERLEEEAAMIDLHAFVFGIDCLAHMENVQYSAVMSEPEHPSVMINRQTHTQPSLRIPVSECPVQRQGVVPLRRRRTYKFLFGLGRITLKQLGVLKFTAMFVARYGLHFCRDLMKKVGGIYEFEFMEPSNSKFALYDEVLDAYSRVIRPCDDACTADVVAGFLRRLELEKLYVDGESNIDMHAFSSGVEYFADKEDVGYCDLVPPAEPLLCIMKEIPPLRYGCSMEKMQTARSGERESRGKETKGPYWIMIRVSGADDYGGVFEIGKMGELSLSDKVASLKKRIGLTIQIPAHRQMLSGKAGVLEDNRSLAHYNVGAGEILTVSW
ncbi:unnamed protein product [Arabidopsis arenosa]|nr:unnamed protein product [Arabidopsis arenosa]